MHPVNDYTSTLSSIHRAARSGHVDLLKSHLKRLPTLLDYHDQFDQTPLLFAAAMGQVEVVRFLLTQSAKIHLPTRCPGNEHNGKTPLIWALEGGYYQVVEILLAAGAYYQPLRFLSFDFKLSAIKGHVQVMDFILKRDHTVLNKTDKKRQTALIWAAMMGKTTSVAYLLSQGANVQLATYAPKQDDHGKTALQWAVERGHDEITIMLLDHGAIYTPLDDMQCDLIHLAAMRGHVKVVKCLLERDRTLLNKTDSKGQTALLWAAKNGHSAVMAYLLEQGANNHIATNYPERENEHGKNPLKWAVIGRHLDAVLLLMDQSLPHEVSFDLIQIAFKNNDHDIVGLLLKRRRLLGLKLYAHTQQPKAHPFATSLEEAKRFQTPMQWAIEEGHEDIYLMLLEEEITYTPIDDLVSDPIHIAAQKGHLSLVKRFLDSDRSLLNKTDAKGQTAFLWAAANGHKSVLQYLLDQGADTQIATNDPEHPEHHNRSPLQWAIAQEYFSCASLILQKILNKDNLESLLACITSAEIAIEFILADASNQAILYQNKRIKGLLDQWNDNAKHDRVLYYYKYAGRRPSFYAEIDQETGASVVYEKGRPLGDKSSHCQVMDFVSSTNKHVVVKYLEDNWLPYRLPKDKKVLQLIKDRALKEHTLRNKAYPGNSTLFFFERQPFIDDETYHEYTARDVSELIDGEQLNTYFAKTQSINHLVTLLLDVTNELLLLHKKDIIHGDIKGSNIMMTKVGKIKLIDFGCSDLKTDKIASTFPGDVFASNIAPERYGNFTLEPNFKQDIWGLGDLFYQLLKNHKQKLAIYKLYPCLATFVSAAFNREPEQRPSLLAFRDEFQSAYEKNRLPEENSSIAVGWSQGPT